MKYILSSAVITTAGYYHYELITVAHAVDWLHNNTYESTIGYPETAVALSAISGIQIPVNRHMVQMQAGDEALVFRLTCRLNNPKLKGTLTPDFVMQNCEIGILTKEA